MSKEREELEKQARQRQEATRFGGKGKISSTTGQTRDIIGKELGISGRQVDKLHVINKLVILFT